jgi:hypothetical protein
MFVDLRIIFKKNFHCFRSLPNQNAANVNIVADLYAEVVGVLAQSRLVIFFYIPI